MQNFLLQDGSPCSVKSDGLKRNLHSIESSDYQMGETMIGTDLIYARCIAFFFISNAVSTGVLYYSLYPCSLQFIFFSSCFLNLNIMAILAGDSREIDEEAAKEWEHTLLQNTMDKELYELNRRLEEKEVYFMSSTLCNIVQ